MNDCEFLEWDSHFFGLRVGRYSCETLSGENARAARLWCAENNIDCLYYLASSSDPASVIAAEDAGFRFVDIRITLSKHLAAGQSHTADAAGIALRSAAPEDVPTLRNIASAVHTRGRFYSDVGFGRAKASALYAHWIAKSCDGSGFADCVIVADLLCGGNADAQEANEPAPSEFPRHSQVAGYVTCKLSENGVGKIGLIGVDSSAQKRGVGRALVLGALDWFSSKDVVTVEVVTQGNNVESQRLYQACGFATRRVELWYHLWPKFATARTIPRQDCPGGLSDGR